MIGQESEPYQEPRRLLDLYQRELTKAFGLYDASH